MHAKEELLVAKDEPQDVEQPQAEDHGVAETTRTEPSTRNGRKPTIQAERLMADATEHVGAPKSQRKKRRSPDRYNGYMALMSECIVTKPSSFEESMQKPTWVDAMVEEYDSIIRNNA